jgi:pseudouridine-5'-monophosphatase
MDGLLIDSEDIVTTSTNQLLAKYGRPPFTPSVRAQLMGIPDSTNSDVFFDWANVPLPRETFTQELKAEMKSNFSQCKPLLGAADLLLNLSRATNAQTQDKINIALATSSQTESFRNKTSRSETRRLLELIPGDNQVLGDDPGLRKGRGKPAPDMYLIALDKINAGIASDKRLISANECLVFEDSVIGVEAGRRAGMQVVWVPHPEVAAEYREREREILAGRTGMVPIGDEHQLGMIDDGLAQRIASLEQFDYEKYGITVEVM